MKQKGRVIRAQMGVAARLRHDDETRAELRREFLAVRLEEHIEQTLATFPPLSSDQRARLRALLADSPEAGAA